MAESEFDRTHGAHTLRVWRGMIVGIHEDDVFVELGPRMQGVLSTSQFTEPPELDDAYDFTLRGKEGTLWALALLEEDSLSSWEDMEAGSLVEARILRCIPGGLQVKIGELHGFMPRGHCGLPRESDALEIVGITMTCEVIEVDPERQRVIVSRKEVLRRERDNEHQRHVSSVHVGQVVHGRISRIEDYGVFLSFGRGLSGLIHISNLSNERLEHPSEAFEMDQHVDAKVLYVKQRGKRIALGVKQMEESPWRAVEQQNFTDQIVMGRVMRVMHYGAFIRLQAGVEGLLHISQVGLAPGRRLREALRGGQELSVRITAIDCAQERMSLSLLHRDGALIGSEEARDRQSFDELLGEASERPCTGLPLGRLLRDALGQSRQVGEA